VPSYWGEKSLMRCSKWLGENIFFRVLPSDRKKIIEDLGQVVGEKEWYFNVQGD
jgi:hypothetical protein